VAPLTNSTTWALGYPFPTDEQLSEFSLPYRNNQGEIGYTPGVDPEEWAKEKVHGQTYWAVVLVRGNATLLALEALAGRVDSYDRESFSLSISSVAKQVDIDIVSLDDFNVLISISISISRS
jgi:hypothetical protein